MRCTQRGLAMRKLSVRPSVCPSVKHVNCDKTEERYTQIFNTIRKIINPSFMRRRMVSRLATPSTWNFGSSWPCWSEIADFQSIFARSSSAVTPSKNVQLTLIGSLLRAFQRGKDEHRTLLLSTQKVAQKRKVSKIWIISCDNSEAVQDRMSVSINH